MTPQIRHQNNFSSERNHTKPARKIGEEVPFEKVRLNSLSAGKGVFFLPDGSLQDVEVVRKAISIKIGIKNVSVHLVKPDGKDVLAVKVKLPPHGRWSDVRLSFFSC